MANDKQEIGNTESSRVQEAGSDYVAADKAIIVSSIQEQEDDNYMYWASLSPEQRLELHHHMISRIYSNELKESRPYNEQPIHFD
jgi:hypothetical protein